LGAATSRQAVVPLSAVRQAERATRKACVQIKFRAPHAINATLCPQPNSLVDFHTA
jgi:hypothetical protein